MFPRLATTCLLLPLLPWIARAEEKIDFSSQIRPLLSKNCYHCHGPDEKSRRAKLRLDLREDALKLRHGAQAIKAGAPEQSLLLDRIRSTDPEFVMPPPESGHALKPEEVELFWRWIKEGAAYSPHWAFVKPVRPALPRAKKAGWARNPIDAFVLAKLEAHGLQPAPEANRYLLARRVALDLTGLPPDLKRVEAFVQDSRPDAYERYVDELLASPAYGERWARVWLDLARYADSAGYGSDPLRLNIWPYRDWVIHALNRNLPYDQFTREQLAGDLLPHPTPEQLTATAFHRNTMTNTEGGTIDEEWRVAAVKDRTATTFQVWMGLTMGCAQCHSHKFDPISQREFYQAYALFNQTEDSDREDEYPTLPVPTEKDRQRMAELRTRIATLQKEHQQGSPALGQELAAWEKRQREIRWTRLDSTPVSSGQPADQHRMTLQLPPQTRALRLELLPEDGPVTVRNLRAVVRGNGPPKARFLRIEQRVKEHYLALAEVQVFSNGQNIAVKGKARQSSTAFGGDAARAIDGNTNGDFFGGQSVTHTGIQDRHPWWEVDLGQEYPLEAVSVWNRTDGGLEFRLSNWRIVAFDEKRAVVWESVQTQAPRPSVRVPVTGDRILTFVGATADDEMAIFDVAQRGAKPNDGWTILVEVKQPTVAVLPLAKPETGPVELQLLLEGINKKLRYQVAATSQEGKHLAVPGPLTPILQVPEEKRSTQQKQALLAWFAPHSATAAANRQAIAALEKELASIKPVAVPVMRELPKEKQRQSHILNKGNYLDPGAAVGPGVPTAFGPWPQDMPLDRRGLAAWLFSPENPLTARVAVNRLWAQLFGTGLVETEEDFGTQGQLPSHRELLDWLAVEFREQGWDQKKMLKLIVTSATYRQSSRVTPELLKADPRGRLLSRYPRQRLDAEQIRDQALALSGLLSKKIGGPSVYPPQPEGLWRAAFNGQRTYPTSTGEDRYRRGLYTIWRRTVPYPSMATFDAPSRETCTVKRIPTNTPLHAYVTLNDPVFVEAAQALGHRLSTEGGTDTVSRIRYGLRLALGRPAEEKSVQALLQLYEESLARFRAFPEEAKKLATSPTGQSPTNLDVAETATWTVIGNVLLNLDGVLMKG